MANSNKKSPKKKHSFADVMKVYKKRFAKLDKKTKIQMGAIVAIIILIVLAAVMALTGRGKNPASSSELLGDSFVFSGSYDPQADTKYEDAYTKQIAKYDDVVIPESDTEDRNYFRETLFVGDSNTEGLAVYNHLSLQYVLGVTGMPIQTVTTNKCMWFVGYEEPVTIPTAIGMLKPRRIIINYGTNNAGGTETEDFIHYYENALDVIEKAYPYADIIVSSVLPVAKERSYPNITMQDIDEFNLALAEMCRDRGLKFLNTAELFKDPDNGFMKTEYVAKDGIHLSSEGYKAFLEYVGNHKHIEPDTRPARGTIPTRRNAPYVAPSSSETASSSVASSKVSSSSIFSSSIVSSSSVVSSSSMSSSQGSSSSSAASSSDVISSSSSTSSSESASSSSSSSEAVSSSSSSSEDVNSSVSSSEDVSSSVSSSEVAVKCSLCSSTEHNTDGCDKKCTEHGTAHTDESCPRYLNCSFCSATGHTVENCTVKCKEHGTEHTDESCPRYLNCSFCSTTGHTVENCTVKCKEHGTEHADANCPRYIVCELCSSSGHNKDTCPSKCTEHGAAHLDTACDRYNANTQNDG